MVLPDGKLHDWTRPASKPGLSWVPLDRRRLAFTPSQPVPLHDLSCRSIPTAFEHESDLGASLVVRNSKGGSGVIVSARLETQSSRRLSKPVVGVGPEREGVSIDRFFYEASHLTCLFATRLDTSTNRHAPALASFGPLCIYSRAAAALGCKKLGYGDYYNDAGG